MPDRLRLLRPQDLLVLDVRLVNLQPSADGTVLERIDPGQPARFAVELPPQHVAERAHYEFTGSKEPAGPPPVATLAAGPSRLVFALPDDVATVPLSLAGLLDWDGLEPVLAPGALPPGTASGPSPAPPGEDETAIEFPYRLLISPVGPTRWVHATAAVTLGGRTELWHTRLLPDDRGGDPGDGSSPPTRAPVPLRALHARAVPDRMTTSMALTDLTDLVTLTSGFTAPPRRGRGTSSAAWARLLLRQRRPAPVPLEGERVVLTSLGASVRLQGSFDPPQGAVAWLGGPGADAPSLARYVHVAGLGRDQRVEVVRRGFVDTGHRAVVVRVTERRYEAAQVGTRQGPHGTYGVYGTQGYLRQHYQVLITQPLLDTAGLAEGFPHGGREMPLRAVEITTLSSPALDLPMDPGPGERAAQLQRWFGRRMSLRRIQEVVQIELEDALKKPWWLRAAGQDVLFDLVGTDWLGRRVAYSRPLMFVPEVAAADGAGVVAAFVQGPDSRRRAVLSGQVLALADRTGAASPEATSSPVGALTFALDLRRPGAPLPGYRPSWVSRLGSAGVALEPLDRLTGSAELHEVRLTPDYLAHGLDPAQNPTGGFATIVGAAARLDMGAAEGGGLSAPSMDLDTLSARAGLVSSALAGGLDAVGLSALFGGMKLFGTVPLARLLGPVPAATPDLYTRGDVPDDALDAMRDDPDTRLEVPILRSRVLRDGSGAPVGVRTRFLWKPVLRTDPGLTPLLEVGGARFVLDVVTTVLADEAAPQVHVVGELSGFSMVFAGVAELRFGTLRFETLPGRKPDVSAQGVSLTFVGALEFVNTLRDLLPGNGFSDPPAVTVDEQGIRAGFSLAVPTIGVGVFSLQNLALSSSLSVPFVGKAAGLRFALSERHHPFLVTVTLFGGGGFFALGISANGVEEIEASIEFGGNVSLDIGVASGGVYVMAGVYFGMTAQVTQLTGYLRMGGHLSVLGLICVSLEFYLAFTWRDKGGGRSEIWGQASLTVGVKVAFFSTSVTLSVERRFAGASGDPTLDQVMEPDDWEAYCLAFAEEGP
ncbi:hypothetical protein [Ornithinimicrobium avium]|uniref:Uncharacterized protein n=1 Tax=Ornithinimicrobium avium TaxID=2283195 RepID=A0A345NKH6_9MICO|nr:hypothetical protein [Ornithinimicrobium avium]AXH95534.1 hypothetical protein DV701_04780 [Ornithinimicrobium avium]